MTKKNPCDFTIIITVAMLVVIGIIMVFSSSYSYSLVVYNDGYHFLKRVLPWAFIGSFGMYVCSNISYWKWGRHAGKLFILSTVLLILVLTPLGMEINGAKRWIGLGPITIMPSEIAKFAVVIFVATSINRKQEKMQSFIQGVLPYLFIIGLYFGLIYAQPDFSTAFVVACLVISMIFVGGMKLSHFIGLIAAGFTGIAGMVAYLLAAPHGKYKARRILAFLDPWADPQASGFQAIQSLLALGSGGLFGRGLGRSVQKHFYLPEPQNDFIFAIIGEELGFIGGLTVILLFMILIWRGIRVAVNAPDLFGCLLATGITTMVIVQVIINIAVATSSMPVTGMPLPFISYGGNSLGIFMAAAGILLNISRYINIHRS